MKNVELSLKDKNIKAIMRAIKMFKLPFIKEVVEEKSFLTSPFKSVLGYCCYLEIRKKLVICVIIKIYI